MSITALNASKQTIKFDIYDIINISYLNVDMSKFGLLQTTDVTGSQCYVITYDSKAFVLILDAKSKDMHFSNFGLKECMAWDERLQKYIPGSHTGEYDIGIKLINNMQCPENHETKLIHVLDSIHAAIVRDLIAFDEVSPAVAEERVKTLYNRSSIKDLSTGKPKKVAGKIVFDDTKSPVFNLRCKSNSYLANRGSGSGTTMKLKPVITCKLLKPNCTEQYDVADLINKRSRGVYFVKFGKLGQIKSGFGTRAYMNSAILDINNLDNNYNSNGVGDTYNNNDLELQYSF